MKQNLINHKIQIKIQQFLRNVTEFIFTSKFTLSVEISQRKKMI